MPNLITIHNAETGEIIEREMNAEELAQLEARKNAWNIEQEELLKKEQARAALLAKLGITEDEAKLLLGGN
jgi:multidrug efflux pump subunit AcrA (membrane-fusion protein)